MQIRYFYDEAQSNLLFIIYTAGELSPRHEAGAMHGKKVPVPNYVRQEATGGYSR